LEQFAEQILQINSRIDFQVSSRGWCYLLEGLAGLKKGDFNIAQSLITDCRKSGLLPMDICAEDSAREFSNLELIDQCTPDEYVGNILRALPHQGDYYNPASFWSGQPYYVEMLVEKVDLRSLFSEICAEFHVPIANGHGWSDLHTRASMKRRFQYWEQHGNQCVLLYCGDFDPIGLHISEHLRHNLDEIEAVPWSAQTLIIDRFGLNFDFIEANGLS